MTPAPFAFGQTVFVVQASPYGHVEVPCPICFGRRWVTLILGNGESQPVQCEYCARGCEPCSGTIRERRPTSSVSEGTVDGMEYRDDGWVVRVGIHSARPGVDVFATREEAEARREVLFAEAKLQAEEIAGRALDAARKRVSWNAGYHRARIREYERSIEYHRRKLAALDEKVAT